MKEHRIVLLPGDGIGPEISEVTIKILLAVSRKNNFLIHIEEKLFGASSIQKYGEPLSEDTLQACKASDAVLLAAIGDPQFDTLPRSLRPESGLLKLRSSLDLFANIRPVKVIPALMSASSLKQEVVKDVDLLVVRELTGGIYFGEPKGLVKTEHGKRAFNTMVYSDIEIDRIARVAFELACSRRQKLCSIDKANVLDVSQLWRERVCEMANKYQTIDVSHQYVDNAAMQLVKDPSQFDVILTSNLFGDIISDEAAMISGSIGMLPSASINNQGPGLFEPVHGSAPDIAGQDIANPIAMILSAAMMLRIGLKENNAAKDIEKAVDKVLNNGFRTIDIANSTSKPLGCRHFGEEILQVINSI